MPRFPYMNFPFPYYRNYYRIPPSFTNNSTQQAELNNYTNNLNSSFNSAINNHPFMHDSSQNIVNNSTSSNSDNRSFNVAQKNKSNDNDNYLFDLFGLKIYTDDILLVSLIYLLYSEEVKDESLFIVLILLLLS